MNRETAAVFTETMLALQRGAHPDKASKTRMAAVACTRHLLCRQR
jgi:hypothetical protein